MKTEENTKNLKKRDYPAFVIIVFFISFLIFIGTKIKLSEFPPRTEVLPQLLNEPRQVPVEKNPFTVIAEDREYLIEPFFEYELYGMIVSYNQSSPLYQIVHWLGWKDFINVKDVCVVWGDNIFNEVYQGMDFHSGSYTCYPRYKPETAWEYHRMYNEHQLSNNHLLSNDKKMKQVLWDSIRGDQVHLKGYLVRYSHGKGAFQRGTSIVRTDAGNGACETIYLTDFRIIKRAHPLARKIHKISVWSMIISLLLFLWMDPLFETFQGRGQRHPWWQKLKAVEDRK